MDFLMSTDDNLHSTVSALISAGHVDAAQGNPRVGDAGPVLSVSADDDDAKADVQKIVRGIDPVSRLLSD